jgi:uncharacterized metal-binding protein YceD (DUF177 family)
LKAFSDYKIQYASLILGTHVYEFDVDKKFFEEFDCFDYLNVSFKVQVELTKQSTMMLLNFSFEGNIMVPCDRCLDEVEVPVSGAEKLIVKFGNEAYDETDDILILPENEHELNVAKYIYEFIQLNIPQKKAHQEGECNPEVIKKLEKIENKKESDIDPRWSDLNKLK